MNLLMKAIQAHPLKSKETPKARWRDPDWKYRPSDQTNIRLTFARLRKLQKEGK